MKVVKLNSSESGLLSRLCNLYNEVFDEGLETPPFGHFQKLLEYSSVLFFVLLDDEGEVIAGLTAHTLPNIHSVYPELYIYDIAVKQDLQRSGIGTMLMNALFDYARENGYSEIFVQADKVDGHAINFYKKLGGAEEDVFHYSFKLK